MAFGSVPSQDVLHLTSSFGCLFIALSVDKCHSIVEVGGYLNRVRFVLHVLFVEGLATGNSSLRCELKEHHSYRNMDRANQ